MIINKTLDNTKLYVALEGRLDIMSAPILEKELEEFFPKINELILDFQKLSYISSAGLRIVLNVQKQMSLQGSMKIIGANATIMEVFDITGFAKVLTLE